MIESMPSVTLHLRPVIRQPHAIQAPGRPNSSRRAVAYGAPGLVQVLLRHPGRPGIVAPPRVLAGVSTSLPGVGAAPGRVLLRRLQRRADGTHRGRRRAATRGVIVLRAVRRVTHVLRVEVFRRTEGCERRGQSLPPVEAVQYGLLLRLVHRVLGSGGERDGGTGTGVSDPGRTGPPKTTTSTRNTASRLARASRRFLLRYRPHSPYHERGTAPPNPRTRTFHTVG